MCRKPSAAFGDEAALRVAGVPGKTQQALSEAGIARGLEYDAALLNVAVFASASEDETLEQVQSGGSSAAREVQTLTLGL